MLLSFIRLVKLTKAFYNLYKNLIKINFTRLINYNNIKTLRVLIIKKIVNIIKLYFRGEKCIGVYKKYRKRSLYFIYLLINLIYNIMLNIILNSFYY